MKVTLPDGKIITAKSFSFDSDLQQLTIRTAAVPRPEEPDAPDPEPEQPEPEQPSEPTGNQPDIQGRRISMLKPIKHGERDVEIRVPPKDIICSEFNTGAVGYGSIAFDCYATPGGYRDITFWLSLAPGAEPVDDNALSTKAGSTFSLLWNTKSKKPGKVQLKPHARYYFNMMHKAEENITSALRRYVG